MTPVASKKAGEQVRVQLIDQIRSGTLAVDDRLPSEAELAKAFGVSRSVIREALNSLNALGLTRSHAGKGTFVAANDVTSALLLGLYRPEDLNEVRRCLEVPVARLTASRRTDDDLARLAELVEAFDATDDAPSRVEVDSDFHVEIARATGNPLFPKLIGELRQVLQEQALRASRLPGRANEARAEHRRIYEAIASGDGEAAAAAMDAHLSAVIHLVS